MNKPSIEIDTCWKGLVRPAKPQDSSRTRHRPLPRATVAEIKDWSMPAATREELLKKFPPRPLSPARASQEKSKEVEEASVGRNKGKQRRKDDYERRKEKKKAEEGKAAGSGASEKPVEEDVVMEDQDGLEEDVVMVDRDQQDEDPG